MTEKENKLLLKLIAEGLKQFPKVLARKERAFKEKQKRMKAFASLSKALHQEEKKATALTVKSSNPNASKRGLKINK
jgi:hypothetical protein